MEDSPPDAIPDPGTEETASRFQRRRRAVEDALRTAVRDFYGEHFGAGNVPSGPVTIDLSVRVDPSATWSLTFVPPLEDQLQPQLAGAGAAAEVLVPGHVHCFRCASSRCEHAVPRSPLEVFRGYDAQGRPEWQELTQTLVDERNERVDQLYGPRPTLVASFQFGRTLRGRQLAAFGRGSVAYSILGQVVAGYYPDGSTRRALTVQAVEGRRLDGSVLLALNPVMQGMDERRFLEWVTAEARAPVFRSLRIAERELAALEDGVAAARAGRDVARANQLMGRVPSVLKRLADGLERGGRQEGRRTRHVEARRNEQRPVAKALEDVAAAGPESCFFDEKAGTYVVIGDRGRAHAFSGRGRHVTSFVLKPSAVAFRVRTRRWRPVDPQEWKDVRATFTMERVRGTDATAGETA